MGGDVLLFVFGPRLTDSGVTLEKVILHVSQNHVNKC